MQKSLETEKVNILKSYRNNIGLKKNITDVYKALEECSELTLNVKSEHEFFFSLPWQAYKFYPQTYYDDTLINYIYYITCIVLNY